MAITARRNARRSRVSVALARSGRTRLTGPMKANFIASHTSNRTTRRRTDSGRYATMRAEVMASVHREWSCRPAFAATVRDTGG